MKTMQKFLQVILALLAFGLMFQNGFAQKPKKLACEAQFEGEAEAATAGKNNGKLYLILKEGRGSFTFKLYDIYNSKKEFTVIKQIAVMSANTKVLVFSDLPPSTYFVQAVGNDCKQMLGGFDGFTIHTK